MAEEIGDSPIQEAFKKAMNDIAYQLDMVFNGPPPWTNRATGFILMVFPFGDDPNNRCNYISNAERADVVRMLKNQIKRFEEQDAEKSKGRN